MAEQDWSTRFWQANDLVIDLRRERDSARRERDEAMAKLADLARRSRVVEAATALAEHLGRTDDFSPEWTVRKEQLEDELLAAYAAAASEGGEQR